MIDWSAVRYFQASEMVCRCGCGVLGVQPALVYALDDLRHAYGKAMVITSAYRCPR